MSNCCSGWFWLTCFVCLDLGLCGFRVAGWCCVGFVSVYEFGVLWGLLLIEVFGLDYGW